MSDEHVSLREYVEALFRVQDEHRKELRDLLRQTVDETRAALAEYKVTSNEWRATLNDVIGSRPDRKEVEAMFAKSDQSFGLAMAAINKLDTAMTRQEGAKAQGVDLRSLGFALIGAGGIIAAIVFGIIAVVGGGP